MGDGRVRGDVCAVSESGVWLCVRCRARQRADGAVLHVVLLPRVCTTSGSTKAEAARKVREQRVWWSNYNL